MILYSWCSRLAESLSLENSFHHTFGQGLNFVNINMSLYVCGIKQTPRPANMLHMVFLSWGATNELRLIRGYLEIHSLVSISHIGARQAGTSWGKVTRDQVNHSIPPT